MLKENKKSPVVIRDKYIPETASHVQGYARKEDGAK